MVQQFNILADMHVHSISSKKGLSTLQENLRMARKNGLQYMALTEASTSIDSDDLMESTKIKTTAGVAIIHGIEYSDPFTEIEDRFLDTGIKWRMLGVHPWEGDFPWQREVFDYIATLEQVCSKFNITAIAHPHRFITKLWSEPEQLRDLAGRFATFFSEKQIYLEINPKFGCEEEEIVFNLLLDNAYKLNARFVLGSGAHYCEQIGEFSETLKHVNRIGIPRERILNTDPLLLRNLVSANCSF